MKRLLSNEYKIHNLISSKLVDLTSFYTWQRHNENAFLQNNAED